MTRWLAVSLVLCLAQGARAEDLTLCREGWDALEKKKLDRALELYQECLRTGDLRPASAANAERNVGFLLSNAQQPAKAAEAYGRALAADPSNAAQDHRSRGWALFEVGDVRGALADFDKSLALSPDEPKAIYGRGASLERLGRQFDAYAEYERAAKLDPNAKGAKERLEFYEKIGLARVSRLRGDGFGKLGSSYEIGAAKPADKLGAILASAVSCLLDDLDPVGLSDHPDAESLRRAGRYEFPNARVAVTFPRLEPSETLDLRIRLDDNIRGVRDDYLTFSSGRMGPARAAVMTTALAKRMRSSFEVHRAIVDEVEELGASFPRGDLSLRDLEGPWGPIVELLVRNRGGGGACFPTSTFALAPPDTRPTMGVTRYVLRGDLLVALALIVPLPKDLPRAEHGEFARARMNEFMGAVSLR